MTYTIIKKLNGRTNDYLYNSCGILIRSCMKQLCRGQKCPIRSSGRLGEQQTVNCRGVRAGWAVVLENKLNKSGSKHMTPQTGHVFHIWFPLN